MNNSIRFPLNGSKNVKFTSKNYIQGTFKKEKKMSHQLSAINYVTFLFFSLIYFIAVNQYLFAMLNYKLSNEILNFLKGKIK